MSGYPARNGRDRRSNRPERVFRLIDNKHKKYIYYLYYDDSIMDISILESHQSLHLNKCSIVNINNKINFNKTVKIRGKEVFLSIQYKTKTYTKISHQEISESTPRDDTKSFTDAKEVVRGSRIKAL